MNAPPAVVVKDSTHFLHTETEQLLFPRLSSVQSTKEYAAILKMFYGFYHPLERKIEQLITADQLHDINERRKAAAALHDLSTIGQLDTDLPLCATLPEIETITQAFGVLYVLEGSTLGGKMIARMLLRTKALSLSEDAITFFFGYKEETGSKWKTFLEAFNKQGHIEELVQSANDTFSYLKRWIQQTLYNEQS